MSEMDGASDERPGGLYLPFPRWRFMHEVSSEDRIPEDVRVVREVYKVEKTGYYNASQDREYELLLQTKPFVKEIHEEFLRKGEERATSRTAGSSAPCARRLKPSIRAKTLKSARDFPFCAIPARADTPISPSGCG